MRERLARPGLVVALAVLAGCTGPASVADPTPAPPEVAGTADLEALYWARQQAAQDRFVQADVDFMTGMIGHQAQALVMADMAPRNGASPAVRTLAARIENAQRDEIATMQRWLRERGQPVPEVHIEGTMLMIHVADAGEGAAMNHEGMNHEGMNHGGMDHGGMSHDHMGMPGMLTQAQLDELDDARGADFDRLFLTYMIQHHGGAVVMVDTLFAADGAGQDEAAFKLASDVQVDQRTEIARMELMLSALPAP